MKETIPPVEEQMPTTETTTEAVAENNERDYSVKKVEIDPKTQQDIEELAAELKFRESNTNKEVTSITQKKESGGESGWGVFKKSESPKPRNWFRNAAMSVAAVFALGTAAKAETVTPGDSTKNKIENKYTGNEAINDVIRQDWNDFQSWLASQNLAGKKELDKGGLGYQLFDQYCKTHKTSLSRETLPLVREELLKLRAKIIADVNAGRSQYAAGANEGNLLKPVIDNEGTGDPNYPGYNFTKFRFPGSTTVTLEQTTINSNKIATEAIDSKLQKKITASSEGEYKVVKTEQGGFVKSKEVIKDRNPIANSDYVKNDVKRANRK